MKFCLVASAGGHLLQLVSLKRVWEEEEWFWVTFPKMDAESLLKGERVFWAHHPTNRNLKNLFKNAWLAWRVLRQERPDAIISTGAGVAVPFLWVGRFLGIKTIYVESITFIENLSLTGRLVYPFVDHFFVQWPDLTSRYAKANYKGQVI